MTLAASAMFLARQQGNETAPWIDFDCVIKGAGRCEKNYSARLQQAGLVGG